MRRITLTVVPALLAGATAAEPTQLFYNESGQITGAASTNGSITTYRDAQGRLIGTAERQRDGSVQNRDAMGRLTASATAPRTLTFGNDLLRLQSARSASASASISRMFRRSVLNFCSKPGW